MPRLFPLMTSTAADPHRHYRLTIASLVQGRAEARQNHLNFGPMHERAFGPCYVADSADGCGSAPLRRDMDYVHHVATAATEWHNMDKSQPSSTLAPTRNHLALTTSDSSLRDAQAAGTQNWIVETPCSMHLHRNTGTPSCGPCQRCACCSPSWTTTAAAACGF